MTKICEICGKEYEPYRCRARYQRACGPVCARKLYSRTAAEWQRRNPDKVRASCERQKARRCDYPKCRVCGGPVVERDTYPGAHRKQTHETCMLKDCTDTIKRGGKLNGMQRQRLAARGYELADAYELAGAHELAARLRSGQRIGYKTKGG